jgi:zinc protease
MMRIIFMALMVLGAACTTSTKGTVAGGRTPPNEPWRTTRPPTGPAPEFKLPNFQRAELKNGMTVYVIEEHGLPMMTVSVVVRAGSAQETAKEAGLAALTYALLDEGAGNLNQLALANEFAALGTKVETYTAREFGAVNVELLKKHADKGLDLLSTVVRKPTFAQADFDRVRAQMTSALKGREGDPGAIADAVGQTLIFGVDHPYGHDENGTASTLEKLNAARVKKFWADNAGPKNAALIIAGDITLEEGKALGEKHFGKWTGTAKPPKAPADPKPREATKIAFVDVPGAPQTVVRFGRAVMARGDADEPAMLMFNEIFGGSFSSRLNLKLREEKQWTYGAFSGVDRRLGKGPFGVFTDVQTPNTVDAVVEILAQIDAVKTGGVTDDELKRAKEGWINSLPSVYGLPMVQKNAAAALFAYNLPPDYFSKLVEAVKAVKAEDVKRVADRALVKEDMVIVLVGDKATVEPVLKEKNLGAITFFNRDGTEAK